MKKKFIYIIIGVLALAGLGFLLFEPISYQIEKQSAMSIADEFERTVEEVEKATDSNNNKKNKASADTSTDSRPTREQLDKLRADSIEYNKNLAEQQGKIVTTNYASKALDLSKYGINDNMYGYISAPSIDMKLPIYLGAGEQQLSNGAAHLYNTSLPLDMTDTNCAVAGHTGYFGRIFFDNIRNLNSGDELSVRNYWQTVRYKVVNKKIVKPTNTSDLAIEKGSATLTLITCVPDDKGGFDRCLVICEKI